MSLMKNDSGITLLVVLWVVVILAVLSLGLHRTSSLGFLLIRNDIGRLKAYAAAKAGINYAEDVLLEQKTDFIKKINIDKTVHFEIEGIQDEEGRINLNAIDGHNSQILSYLLRQFHVDSSRADTIASSIVRWHTNDYGALKNSGKHRPFDRIEELFFVEGMTREIFTKIKDFVTVFPKTPIQGFKIDFDTAPEPVIRAVVRGLFKDADEDLLSAFIRHDPSSLFSSQRLHWNALRSTYGINKPEYFRIHSVGKDGTTGAQSSITAVIYQPQLQGPTSIVLWDRD